jgi:hypothetical protein
MSFTTYCVCPELRPLPSTGITRLQRYYEPLRHPRAPGLSLTGFRLAVAPATPWGFPCCVRFPCVHAVATTPAQRLGVHLCSFIPAVSAFPERVVGSACASTFSRFAQRSLTLRPAHSRCHLFVTRIPKASASSLPPWLLRLLPAGAFAGWDLHPLESAALSRRTPRAVIGRRSLMRTQARPVHKGNGRKQKFYERTVLSLRNNALSSTREGGARSSASLRGCGKAHAPCVVIEPTLTPRTPSM